MSPPIFQFWHSDRRPDYIEELMETFARLNPGMEHRVFSERTAGEFIASHFGRREVEAFRACAVPAMQADYFRYCAVLAMGGAYADADYRCSGSIEPLFEDGSSGLLLCRGATEAFRPASTPAVLNSFLAFERPGHPLPALTLEMATLSIERRMFAEIEVGRSVLFVTGPVLLTGLRLAYGMGSLEALADLLAATGKEDFGRLLAEVIGDYARVEQAFDRVRVVDVEECGVVAEPESTLPYRTTDQHWPHHKASIYR